MNEQRTSARMEPDWYKSWFDSPYYHILYRHRDEAEARQFIDALLDLLRPPADARILDLACGKGRYSRHLADKGYTVTGIDLSPTSIQHARQFETDRLSFFTHDMRLPFRSNYFDFIFNFFTSFGYFEQEQDDLKTLKQVRIGLKNKGVFVLDFFNSRFVADHLEGELTRTIHGITFHTRKYLKGGFVYKDIEVKDGQDQFLFRERVRLYGLDDFERLFELAGLQIDARYGDYQLGSYDEKESPRLILRASKRI